MRLSYDDEIDAAYLRLCEDEDELRRPITSETFRPTGSDASGDDLVLDFDAWGRLVAIEFLTPNERLLPSVLAAAERGSR
jgi:uncharacterized protein YuzE